MDAERSTARALAGAGEPVTRERATPYVNSYLAIRASNPPSAVSYLIL